MVGGGAPLGEIGHQVGTTTSGLPQLEGEVIILLFLHPFALASSSYGLLRLWGCLLRLNLLPHRLLIRCPLREV